MTRERVKVKKKPAAPDAGRPAIPARVNTPAPRPPKRLAPPPGSAKPAGEVWGTKVAMVVSAFNSDITEKLAAGAAGAFQKAGAQAERFDVPGAFEIAGVVSRLGRSRRYDGLVAIGCVIRGQTEHYELVVQQVREGVGRLSASGDVAVTFGVLAVDNRKQAVDRAGGRLGNLGAEAADALLKLIALYRRTAHPALVQPVASHA